MSDDSNDTRDRQMAADERNVDRLWERYDKAVKKGKSEKAERLMDEITEYPTEVSSTIIMHVGMAGGGPSSWLEVEVYDTSTFHGYSSWEVQSVVLCGSYGETKRRHITEGSGLYRLAERLAETFEIDNNG